MLARTVAGFFSNKLDTEVKIKTFYIKPDLRIHADEVQINDKMHMPMIYVGSLDARFSLGDFSEEIRIKNLDIDDLLLSMMVYEDDYIMNIAELFASKDPDKEKKPFNSTVYLDEFQLTKGHVVVWNQNRDVPEKKSMDYSHLDIDSINISLEKVLFTGDTITGFINNITASDRCGFTLDEFSSESSFMVSSKGLDFKNLILKTHATSLDLDLRFIYDSYENYRNFVDSVLIVANIRPSQLTLSDLRYFAHTMGKMTDTLQISTSITGTVSDFVAENFSFSFKDSTDFNGTVRMKGLPVFHETHIVGNVNKMNFTYQDVSEFAIPTPDGKIPLPKELASLKKAVLSGEFYGFHNNFNTKFNLHTNIGNVFFNGALNNDLLIVSNPYYFFTLHANNLNVKDILGLNDDIMVTMMADLSGEGLDKETANVQVSVKVENLEILDNEFKDFDVNASMKDKSIWAKTNLKSDLIRLDFEGEMDISRILPHYNICMNVSEAKLNELNVLKNSDKKMILSTSLKANLEGDGIDNIYGDIIFDNTTYTDSRSTFLMDSLNISLTKNYFDSKDIKVNCDFFDLDVNGIINFKDIGNTFKNYVLNHFHIEKWTERGVKLKDEKQDFYVNMNFKDTETLSRLFMPDLIVSDNTYLTATFTSNNYQLHSTLESDYIKYKDIVFNNLHVKNKTVKNKTTASIRLNEFVAKESTKNNNVKLGIDNVELLLDAHNDSLFIDFSWKDASLKDKNKGLLKAEFVPHEKGGGVLHVASSDVIINDSLWNLSPTCYVDFRKNRISFDEFDIYSGNQRLKIKGEFPRTNMDTLSLEFDNLDVSDFDLLTKGYGIDPDGFINGNLQLSGISDKFTFLSNLKIDDIAINKTPIGNARIDANWNAMDTSIYINAEIINNNDGRDEVLSLDGNYYTSRVGDNLEFKLDMDDVDISIVNVLTKGILSRVEGKLDGDLLVSGSFKKPLIIGEASLSNSACKVEYLNTYYKINQHNLENVSTSHLIKFLENKIVIDDILLVDTLNNYAVVDGVITHDYMKNFTLDVNATLNKFLGMNMQPTANTSFYGTAIASGNLKVSGPFDNITMDINAITMPGTVIDIILTGATTINDNFIVFVRKDVEENVVKTIVPETKENNKFTFNLNADVTQDASVNIHLPSNMGNIVASGTGNIRLGLKDDNLSLYGDYVIERGTFDFNFQNLVRRNFDIKRGGTISWTGSATDADINVTSSYRTKSSISSLGVEMDSTSMVNNINVDCIMRLQEKLTNPTITFGLSLPNATDDINNTVFSVIDTTNQAVMSQQIISLLVLGSFSYSNATLYGIGASNSYNVLTSSLSSWLSQISKDFDIGVRYTPEDNMTAEELEVALSTQLFDDRLTIEGNLGMYTGSRNNVAGNANNIVGDFDISYRFTNRLSFKVYNHSNVNSNYYSYSYESYSNYTQGVGISFSQSFDNIREIFTKKGRNKSKKAKKKLDNEQNK